MQFPTWFFASRSFDTLTHKKSATTTASHKKQHLSDRTGSTTISRDTTVSSDTSITVRAPQMKKVAEQTITSSQPVANLESAIAADVHALVNDERAQEGLAALSLDSELAKIARAHSADMAKNDFFEHTNLDDCSSACRLQEAGYAYRAMGENIYMLTTSRTLTAGDTAQSAVTGWMESPGHRANILRDSYTHQGFGVVVDGDSVYITQVLALPR
jgi:uncharacterized protein YkwD